MDSERVRDQRAGQEAADPDRLLEVAEDTLQGLHDKPARREVVETDRVVLQTEVDRFHRRLSFWQRRLSELRGAAG